jgi:putative transposase
MSKLVYDKDEMEIYERKGKNVEKRTVKVLEFQKKPAYTSQEYSCCRYVDEKNRKDTQEFECKACGNKTNARIWNSDKKASS